MFVMQAVPRASAIIATLALTLGVLDDAHAIDCHSKRGAGHPWAYRQVDGKRCWYNGRPGVNKKLLRWAKAQSPPKSEHTTTEGQRPIEDPFPGRMAAAAAASDVYDLRRALVRAVLEGHPVKGHEVYASFAPHFCRVGCSLDDSKCGSLAPLNFPKSDSTFLIPRMVRTSFIPNLLTATTSATLLGLLRANTSRLIAVEPNS